MSGFFFNKSFEPKMNVKLLAKQIDKPRLTNNYK